MSTAPLCPSVTCPLRSVDSGQLGEVDAPLAHVRLPAGDQQGPPPAEGDQVEVYSRLKEDVPLGWHTAVIKVRGRPCPPAPGGDGTGAAADRARHLD